MVQRYEQCSHCGGEYAPNDVMVKADDGDYVAYADYEKLVKALRRFGHHDSPCAGILDLNEDAECICGFEQALKENKQ